MTTSKRFKYSGLISQTRTGLKKSRPGYRDVLRWPRGEDTLRIHVSTEQIERAVKIMEMVLRRLAQEDIPVQIGNDRRHRTLVTIDGEDLAIRLREKLRRTKHVPTPEERLQMKRSEYHLIPEWDDIPTGDLELSIEDAPSGSRHTWSDGKRARLEQKIDSFVDGVRRVAEATKLRRAEREALHRKWEEERRIRAEAKRQAEEAQRQLDELREEALRWEAARIIRRYVAHLDAALEATTAWSRRALEAADTLDPSETRLDSLRRDEH